MLIRAFSFWHSAAAAPSFALDAHSFTNVNTAIDPWTTPSHTFNASANLIIARFGWEQNQTITSVAVDPAGANIALSSITGGAATVGLNSSHIWGVYSATPFGLSGAKSITLDFSGTTAGSVGISSYIGAAGLPTVFDFDGVSSALTLTSTIAIAGGNEYGHILSVFNCNAVEALTAGGGLTEQHENQGADGGQTVGFGVAAGSLTNPMSPSFTKAGTATRVSLASVLVL